VTATLEDALAVSGCDSATVAHLARIVGPRHRLQEQRASDSAHHVARMFEII
jgi:hypothetical protein